MYHAIYTIPHQTLEFARVEACLQAQLDEAGSNFELRPAGLHVVLSAFIVRA